MTSETAPRAPAASSATDAGRGQLRVFLGMAAGVGKTFRMLLEGYAEQEAGRDVVIGLLETHGRADTAALAEGLPMIPRRRVTYRDTTLEEMDLPAILARAPELCLIDELAHTNAPGVEHAKRYEDVEDVLAAGIDVLSTLNVQHLESLNDQVAERHLQARDDLEPIGERRRLRPVVRLQVADDDVAPLGLCLLSFLEHAVGLADAGGHAEQDAVVAGHVTPPAGCGRSGRSA